MKCPGQDSRYWKPGSIFEVKCPNCGVQVEFFKDDTARKCPACGHRFANPKMDFGCAAYCQFAEQCLGGLPPEVVAERDSLLKDRVALEMKRYFKTDFKRIGHATKVARYAEQIAKKEGGNLAVILCAAYLHDIGIVAAEKENNIAAHGEKGALIAEDILKSLGAGTPLAERVCEIVKKHHTRDSHEDADFKAVFDADLIVNFDEAVREKGADAKKVFGRIEDKFFTKTGREIATSLLEDLKDTEK